jgi:uncharacterized protein (TIGR00255 family)
MTGFGRGRRLEDGVEVIAEIRSVNHRFLDVSVRVPRIYSALEPKIRKLVSDAVHRGKLDVTITRNGGSGEIMDVELDYELAKQYHARLVELQKMLGLAGDVTLADMLTLRDIAAPVEKESGVEREWFLVEASTKDALAALDSMRTAEGAAMWRDMAGRISEVGETAERIMPLVHQVAVAVKERLEKRVAELTGGMALDEDRLLQEVAVMADRADVTEELTRLESHVKQFLEFGRQGSPLGRRLDFLLQELHREVNTIGSKSASTEIASYVVHMKAELEKIREQTQNLE